MRPLLALWFLLLSAVAHATPEFVGVLTNGPDDIRFILSLAPGTANQWAALGDTVDGYALAEYRAAEDILVLKKDGQSLPLKLKTSTVARGGYRGAPMTFHAAKQLIASREGWATGVTYSLHQNQTGDWTLVATRRVENRLEVRFLPVTADSIPASEKEGRPAKIPAPPPRPAPAQAKP